MKKCLIKVALFVTVEFNLIIQWSWARWLDEGDFSSDALMQGCAITSTEWYKPCMAWMYGLVAKAIANEYKEIEGIVA